MSFDIVISDTFRRAAKGLSKKYPSFKTDLSKFVSELTAVPNAGIPLENNLYKARLAIQSKARGKSGGIRVITCVLYKDERILLADIYDKADYDTVDEKQILKNLRSDGFDI